MAELTLELRDLIDVPEVCIRGRSASGKSDTPFVDKNNDVKWELRVCQPSPSKSRLTSHSPSTDRKTVRFDDNVIKHDPIALSSRGRSPPTEWGKEETTEEDCKSLHLHQIHCSPCPIPLPSTQQLLCTPCRLHCQVQDCVVKSTDKPKTRKEAMRSPLTNMWRAAKKEELRLLQEEEDYKSTRSSSSSTVHSSPPTPILSTPSSSTPSSTTSRTSLQVQGTHRYDGHHGLLVKQTNFNNPSLSLSLL